MGILEESKNLYEFKGKITLKELMKPFSSSPFQLFLIWFKDFLFKIKHKK